MANENNNQNLNSQQDGLQLRDILDLVWRLRYWVIISAFVAVVFGFCYSRMQNPVYQRSTTIMLNNESSSGGELSAIAELMGGGTKKRIDNEMFILKSTSMMQKVVEELDLNTRYYHYTMPIADRLNFMRKLLARKRIEYYKDNPYTLVFAVDSLYPVEMQPTSFSIDFRNSKSQTYTVKSVYMNGKKQKLEHKSYEYGQTVALPGCTFTVSIDDSTEMRNLDRYQCVWSSPYICAKGFAGKLKTEIQSPIKTRQSDVLMVTLEDTKPARADDILNTLVIKANTEARDYGNRTTVSTIEFIDQRLLSISSDLADAEKDYKKYQKSNVVVDLTTQSQASIASDRQNQEQLDEVNLQLQLLDMVTEYMNADEPGRYSVIPANIGVSDAGLNSIITSYNTMVAERNRMVANSSENNPRVVSLNTQLADQKHSIEISISNLVKMYKIRQRELERTLRQGKSQLANIPEQQFEMQQLNRRLEVIEPLYLMLQQKREEAQIQMYSQMDNFRVIEMSNGSTKPISPNSRQIYLLSFLLGCCIPIGVVWARMQLRTTVETKKDVTDRISDANVLAVLPHALEENGSLIKRNGRDALSESFRNLRTNLLYLNGVKVIQVSSSILGEGKSFVASNLALSIAHLDKRVLIIGMDIRKPRLGQIFQATNVNTNNTVVGYLINKCDDLDKLVHHTEESHHLDVIFAGPVPPNPTELLSQGREADIINYFRDKYDYIVIDSAPMMPVSDSFIINEYVDATIYTVRANKTPLAMLNDIDEVIHSTTRPVKRVSLVLNDLDGTSSKYRYGYG
ncbi:MAG: polysaccharide biosynthesis tyrosine autokinase [Bacteroidetes bacterium]|nr:polysaccharide biosynthesis tyrosine autokinase [Candidatus Colenecus caballi]